MEICKWKIKYGHKNISDLENYQHWKWMITRRVWDKSWCCEGQGPAVPSSWSVWWIRDWTLNKQNLLVTHNWARLGRSVGHWSGGGLQINNDTITATVWDISDYTQDVSRSMIFLCGEKFSVVAVTHWLMLVITYVCHHKGQVITPSPLSGPVQESLSWLRNLSHFIWYKLSPNVTEKMWLRDAVVVKKCIKILPNALQWLSKLFRKLVNCLLLGTCIIWLIQLLNGCAIPLL